MHRSLLVVALAALALPVQSQTPRRFDTPDLPSRSQRHAEAAPAVARGGATFTVTTTAAKGPGSFYQAVEDASASPGPHRIEFQIDGGGSYQEIFLDDYPELLSETVVIDGDTQGCADREVGPCIRIDGSGIAQTDQFLNTGLDIRAPNVEIRNLVITGFFRDNTNGQGFAIYVADADAVIAGCRIGTDRTGLVTDPDGTPGTGDEYSNRTGIYTSLAYSSEDRPYGVTGLVVGGDDEADTNVISGNLVTGVATRGTGTRIAGNFVGVGADGETRLGNGTFGVVVIGPDNGDRELDELTQGSDAVIENNVVSGNLDSGIVVADGALRPVIAYNLVGTNAEGTTAVPNGVPNPSGLPTSGVGISLDAVDGQVVGNVIGGNTAFGIQVGFIDTPGEDPFVGPLTLSGNEIAYNLVGLGSDAETPIPNGTAGNPNTGVGIVLLGTGGRTVTETAVTANLAAANTRGGLGGLGPAVYGNVFAGNIVGLAADGETPLPNGGTAGVGIGFDQGAHDNLVGATSLDEEEDGNVVGPHAAPIALLPDAGTGNRIGLNTIIRSAASPLPAIEIGLDGPTPNDAGDADEGPNRLQNAPEVLAAAPTGDGSLAVTVRVDTDVANAAYPLTVVLYGRQSLPGAELYAPIGTVEIAEASAGQPVSATLPLDPEFAFDRVSATATDADGNTSELPIAAHAVAAEAPASATGAALSMAGPNPFASSTVLRLEVDRAQSVRAEVFDGTGRRVAVLHEGPVAPGDALALPLDGTSFSAGIYVVRVTGDGWQTSRRLVLAR